jgi:Bifunctional DNA primase/polymerase, N-terminal
MKTSELNNASMNDAADWWRNEVGVNVIPADTKNKIPKVEWKKLQDEPISDEQHEDWKCSGLFDDGIGIIVGKTWHDYHKKGLYLIGIDLDNRSAIDEFCTFKGVKKSLDDLANKGFIIEQHSDNVNRAHVFFFSNRPYKKLSSYPIENENVPRIEVKGAGEHGIMFVTPSPHKNGLKYQVIGNLQTGEFDDVDLHVDAIVSSYGIEYLNGDARKIKNSISMPLYTTEKILEGARHDFLIRYADSMMRKLYDSTPVDDIKKLVQSVNQSRCVPPLPEQEVEEICKDAERFIGGQIAEENVIMIKNTDDDDNDDDSNDVLNGNGEDTKKKNKINSIMAFIEEQNNKLFIDEYQVPHTAVLMDDNGNYLEVMPLNSRRFKNWLSGMYYKEEHDVIDSNMLKDVIGVLSAKATFDSGEPIKLNLRVAQRPESVVHGGADQTRLIWYYDLTNKNWEFVEITSEGWRIGKSNNLDLILFRRYNQLPQVEPSREYQPDILDRFVKLLLRKNLHNEEDRKNIELLVKCYIVSLFIPEIQGVILMPHGGQGSAKTSLTQFIKRLIDPSAIETLSFPHDKNELIQQLSHNYYVCYDNVTGLSQWISDELCRAVSGSGSSKRQLYTDDEDVIRQFKRRIAINGVVLAATKPDLLDRGLQIHLKTIDKTNRLLEKTVNDIFTEMRTQLLGYILDILVKVLKFKEESPSFKLDEYPRMADWAEYGEIISRCMGYQENEFVNAYNANIELQAEEILDSSLVATTLRELMFTKYESQKEWTGTVTCLLIDLETVTEGLKIDTRSKYWPKAASVLGKKLIELEPSLKQIGLVIERSQDDKKRKIIMIRKLPTLPTLPSENQN